MLEKLEKQVQELQIKLKNIEAVCVGSFLSVQEQLKELAESDEEVYIHDVIRLINEEIEKSVNLCMMCKGVSDFMRCEEALETILKDIESGHFVAHDTVELIKKTLKKEGNA